MTVISFRWREAGHNWAVFGHCPRISEQIAAAECERPWPRTRRRPPAPARSLSASSSLTGVWDFLKRDFVKWQFRSFLILPKTPLI